ncbi:MAG: type II/IV secretion system protein [Parcubacteria group bacterium]|nr:type II/IV secretion system protein [Parcubacteria group bacterium]
MGSDNPSIEDLLKDKKGAGTANPADIDIDEEENVQEKYEGKMEKIRINEKEEEAKKTAASLGIGYISLVGFPISPEAIASIPQDESEKLRAICFLNTGEEIRVGAVDPSGEKLEELKYQLEERFHGHVVIYKITNNSFEKAFELYAMVPKTRKVVRGVEITEEELKKFQEEINDFKTLNEKIKGVSTTEMVSMLIASSLKNEASDIHIEAEEKEVAVRFRLDGMLNDVATMPKKDWPQIISRVKLLAGLKINVTDQPQDGRFTIHLSENKVDVRVSTVPTSFGESVVMRLLRSASVGLKFEDLGIRGRAFEQIKREVERPNGMIITTGPTGSGKTTTLYAILTKLKKPEVKIITLEDPVEYELPGINQSQVDYSKKYTFAKGLRSLMRQDPDVIMVGEIRDLDTAEVAVQAALTGHLVVSTIHTNSASGAIPRFLSMKVKPFLLAPALNTVIGQRLVRRVCEKCKEEDALEPDKLERVKEILSKLPAEEQPKELKFYKGKGCEACGGLGYKGRVGIYEIMVVTPEIEEMILASEVSEYKIQTKAIEQGMVTMVQDGLLKALDGLTSVEEVFRVSE